MSVTLTLTETKQDIHNASSVLKAASNVEEEEDEEVERRAELIVFENTTHGLGLKICGGCSTDGKEDNGIFVKRVLPGGLAEAAGEVHVGDLILEVNGQNMTGVTYERAVSMLRQASASNHVELVVTRDNEARALFEEYKSRYGPIASPPLILNDHGTVSDSDTELSKKLGSVLQEAGFDLTDSDDQTGSHSEHKRLNGHISPSLSSVNSDRTSYMTDIPELPYPSRAFSNGYEPEIHRLGKPRDSLSSIFSKKLTQEPGPKLHVNQLESATGSLGLTITPATQAALRRQLTMDEDGRVLFSDFVEAARFVFHNDLEPGSPLVKRSQTVKDNKLHQSQGEGVLSEQQAQVVKERDQLKLEVLRLREELQIRNQATQAAEDQLLNIRKQAQASIEECRALKIKLHLAEEAHTKAQQTESDYEEVVAMLENEVAQLRLQMSKSDAINMQKRLAVLVCQLKKAEMGKKTYEVATEKLTRYVEHSLDTLASVEGSPRLTLDSSKANKKKALQTLSTEGREVIKTVRSLMESVPLPFGWEEAYTAEGVKYYINHLNQTTTWTHPVSCMEHQTASSTSLHQQSLKQQSQQHHQKPVTVQQQQQHSVPPPFHQTLAQMAAASSAPPQPPLEAPRARKKQQQQQQGQKSH